jgi:hypothetical protein
MEVHGQVLKKLTSFAFDKCSRIDLLILADVWNHYSKSDFHIVLLLDKKL